MFIIENILYYFCCVENLKVISQEIIKSRMGNSQKQRRGPFRKKNFSSLLCSDGDLIRSSLTLFFYKGLSLPPYLLETFESTKKI